METNLFRQSTSGNTVLHASNLHPHNLVNSIPYGECRHVRRNCSEASEEDIALEDLSRRFRARGYSMMCMEEAKRKSKSKLGKQLLFEKETTKNQITKQTKIDPHFRLITYNKQEGVVRSIIQKHWHLIKKYPVLGKLVAPPSPHL